MEVTSKPTKDSLNPSLVDPASVSVIGGVDGQRTLQSPGFSGPEEKKAKKVEKDKATTSKAKSYTDKPAKPIPDCSSQQKPQQTPRSLNSTRSGPTGSIALWLF